MNAEELAGFIEEQFPQSLGFCRITQLGEDSLDATLLFRTDFLRPGGTISGPALMGFVDTATYLLILSMIGPVALAVTTNLNINFVRKPPPEDLHATARMLKLGRQLAVVEVHVYSSSTRALVAQATVTYSIPPGSRAP
jgi:uncharacterized protein (TIGR00369 family)